MASKYGEKLFLLILYVDSEWAPMVFFLELGNGIVLMLCILGWIPFKQFMGKSYVIIISCSLYVLSAYLKSLSSI